MKNLANILAKQERESEAIEVLLKHRAKLTHSDQKSVDNVLTYIYAKSHQYQKALDLLKKKDATRGTETLNLMATSAVSSP